MGGGLQVSQLRTQLEGATKELQQKEEALLELRRQVGDIAEIWRRYSGDMAEI